MSGWSKLGQALGGVSDADRADIQAKTMNALANRDANVARAQIAMSKARADGRLGARFGELGLENGEALADLERAGVNYNTLTNGIGNVQEQGFRRAAVDAATAGNWGAGNAQMLGVASGPVEIPKIDGGMLLSNRLVPGGGDVSVTPVGAAQIGADNARGQAALINANRPRASGGGGRSASAPKLSEIDKLRLKSALAPIAVKKQALLDRISQGGRASEGAEAELEVVLQAEQAVFNQFDGGGPVTLGDSIAPPSTLEQPMSDETYYVAEDGTQVQVPRQGKADAGTRDLYRKSFDVARSLETEARAAIAAGADPAKVHARLKAEILRRTKGK